MTIRTIDIPQLVSPFFVKYKVSKCDIHPTRPSVAFYKERYIEGCGVVGRGMCMECLNKSLATAKSLHAGFCGLCDTFYQAPVRKRLRLCIETRQGGIYSVCPKCIGEYIKQSNAGVKFKPKSSVFSGALHGPLIC